MKRTHRISVAKPPTAVAMKPGFRAAVRQDSVLEILIYDDIGEDWWSGGGITAKTIRQTVDRAGAFSEVMVRINSPGGDAFEGVAIGNVLKSLGKPVNVIVDGVAASAASVIAMCGGTITMASNAMMMIHNAWTFAMGDTKAMSKMADTLKTIDGAIAQTYVDRCGMKMEDVRALMDEETWMTAADALEKGFCTAVAKDEPAEEALAMARGFKTLAKYKRTPKDLAPAAVEDTNAVGCDCECLACMEDDCENCTNRECADSNCEDCPMQTNASSNSAAGEPAAAASTEDPANTQVEVPAAVVEAANLSLFQAQAYLHRRRV